MFKNGTTKGTKGSSSSSVSPVQSMIMIVAFELSFLLQVGNNLKEVQLQQIVDKTILQFDRDGDGKISYEEFAYVSILDFSFLFFSFLFLKILKDVRIFFSFSFVLCLALPLFSSLFFSFLSLIFRVSFSS